MIQLMTILAIIKERRKKVRGNKYYNHKTSLKYHKTRLKYMTSQSPYAVCLYLISLKKVENCTSI